MTDALRNIITRPGRAATPQHGQADPRQVPNSAGGWTFTVPGEARILRFLTLGTQGGTYYVSEKDLTKDTATVVLDWARTRSHALADLACEISVAGRAPRNNPALFALAAAASLGDALGRRYALSLLPQVARTGTHLFTFTSYLEQFRGWGPVARTEVARWYTGQDADDLAYQLVKYRQRDGWSHADVLRMAHPKPRAADGTLMAAHDALFRWVTGSDRYPANGTALPRMIEGYELARDIERESGVTVADKTRAYTQLIRDYPGLPWEALGDEATGQADVWRALIDQGLPVTALIRQLPKLTRLGVLAPMSAHLRTVTERLTDPEVLKRGRVHPVALLIAAKTYASGRSQQGSSTWTPVPQVTSALSDAFYAAYGAVEPSGKRTLIALDVSGSMGHEMAGHNLSAREVTAAMSLVVMATEPAWGVYGFSTQFMPLQLSPQMRLDDAVRYMTRLPFGGTDCSLPMLWAAQHRTEVDTFQIWTDSETWAGRMHPHEALEAYRQQMGIGARLQVIATTSTEFSIADPEDPGSLDVAGFDAAVPRLLADHARGDL